MMNLKIKKFIYLFFLMSGVLWISIVLFTNVGLSKFQDFFLILLKVAIIDLMLTAIFIKWTWKFKIFQGWLVPFPNLNGTWEGRMQTTWVNTESPGPSPVILTIRQSLGRISCVMRTSEMILYGFDEEFKRENDKQIRQLSFSYTREPNLKGTDKSTVHDGTIVLEIVGTPASKLKGYYNYSTDRKTTGEVTFEFRSRDHSYEIPGNLDRSVMCIIPS